MPLHLTRRHFLVSSSAILAFSQTSFAAANSNPNFFALLSDTHVPENPDVSARGVNMTQNLQNVIQQISQLPARPSNLIINGDCAYLTGKPEDYQNLATCLQPLDSLDIALHLTMGNHDDRKTCFSALTKAATDKTPVESKHVAVIEGEFANWFLLDSLFKVNVVTGQLGKAQIDWLAAELDQRADKPALVMLHHNPQFVPPTDNKPWNGVEDTQQLFDALSSRKQIRAVIFGHTHTWTEQQHGSIRMINLPPVAYVFADGQPSGWVKANVTATGLHLELVTSDPKHPKSGQVIEVKWG